MPEGLETLYEDDDWWAINKPTGMLTTAADEVETDRSVVSLAREERPDAERIHATSRLDRGVTGIVLLAKTGWAIAAALEARKNHAYVRRYIAVCAERGASSLETAGRWSGAIGVSPDARKFRQVVETLDKKRVRGTGEAATNFDVLATVDCASLLALRPETGRTHQLRVHCAHAGAPIWGDRAYGGPSRHTFADGRVQSIRRPLLHCHRVNLTVDGRKSLALEAPIAADLCGFWSGLGGDETKL